MRQVGGIASNGEYSICAFDDSCTAVMVIIILRKYC